MVLKSDQQRMKELLKETITLLCKNGLHYKSEFCVEALIGITLDHDDVFLVNIKETIKDELKAAKDSSNLLTHDGVAEKNYPINTETDSSIRRKHSEREGKRKRTNNQVNEDLYRPTSSGDISRAAHDELGYTCADVPTDVDMVQHVKEEDDVTHSSCSVQQTESLDRISSVNDHRLSESIERSPPLSAKKRRISIENVANDNSSNSDDVVFVKDEPLSDSELQQVTLGIAQAQSQSLQQLGFGGVSNQGVLAPLVTQPLPGCSNWSGEGPPVSLGASLGEGDQDLSEITSHNSSSQLQLLYKFWSQRELINLMDDLHGDEAGSNFIPCPFCLEDTFRAGHILKVKSHIKVHWDSGADVEGVRLLKCFNKTNGCCPEGVKEKRPHYHCPYCQKTIINKKDTLKHLHKQHTNQLYLSTVGHLGLDEMN